MIIVFSIQGQHHRWLGSWDQACRPLDEDLHCSLLCLLWLVLSVRHVRWCDRSAHPGDDCCTFCRRYMVLAVIQKRCRLSWRVLQDSPRNFAFMNSTSTGGIRQNRWNSTRDSRQIPLCPDTLINGTEFEQNFYTCIFRQISVGIYCLWQVPVYAHENMASRSLLAIHQSVCQSVRHTVGPHGG